MHGSLFIDLVLSNQQCISLVPKTIPCESGNEANHVKSTKSANSHTAMPSCLFNSARLLTNSPIAVPVNNSEVFHELRTQLMTDCGVGRAEVADVQ